MFAQYVSDNDEAATYPVLHQAVSYLSWILTSNTPIDTIYLMITR